MPYRGGVEVCSGWNNSIGLPGLPFHDFARRVLPAWGSPNGIIGPVLLEWIVSTAGARSISKSHKAAGVCGGAWPFGVGESHSIDARFFNREIMAALGFVKGRVNDLQCAVYRVCEAPRAINKQTFNELTTENARAI